MHHPRTVLALVLTGTLLLGAGCSDEGAEADPQPILPSSSSASPTDEPSPSASPTEAPTMPAAAEERSYPGAEAFVRHWVAVFNFATRTGDTEELEELGTSSCSGCSNSIETIRDVYDNGGRIESEGWTVRRVGVTPSEGLASPVVAARILRSPQVFMRKSPDREEEFGGGPAAYLFAMDWRGARWQMTGVQVLDA